MSDEFVLLESAKDRSGQATARNIHRVGLDPDQSFKSFWRSGKILRLSLPAEVDYFLRHECRDFDASQDLSDNLAKQIYDGISTNGCYGTFSKELVELSERSEVRSEAMCALLASFGWRPTRGHAIVSEGDFVVQCHICPSRATISTEAMIPSEVTSPNDRKPERSYAETTRVNEPYDRDTRGHLHKSLAAEDRNDIKPELKMSVLSNSCNSLDHTDTLNNGPPTKKRRFDCNKSGVKRNIDLIKSHRQYCPYVSGFASAWDGDNGSCEPVSPHQPGWKIVLLALFHKRADRLQDESNGLSKSECMFKSMKQMLRSVP